MFCVISNVSFYYVLVDFVFFVVHKIEIVEENIRVLTVVLTNAVLLKLLFDHLLIHNVDNSDSHCPIRSYVS